jgi:hypothetical protein
VPFIGNPGLGPAGAKPTLSELPRVAHQLPQKFQKFPKAEKSAPSMAVFAPRARTISVRLSHEEFSDLERFCVEKGARSISDLARNAICGFLNQAQQENKLISTMNEYSAQVKELEQRVERLITEIALLKGEKQLRTDRATEGN